MKTKIKKLPFFFSPLVFPSRISQDSFVCFQIRLFSVVEKMSKKLGNGKSVSYY